jgi:antirestriction protein ArdC
MSEQIRQHVTDRILKALEQDQVPWGTAWLGHRNDGPATNAMTSLPFWGVNVLLLDLTGFPSKWWATERCWRVFGFRVKPHQKGTQVFYHQAGDLKGEMVFNAEQVDGPGVERYLFGDAAKRRSPDFDGAERVVAATKADIRHVNGTQAVYYRLPKDYIILPPKAQFTQGLPAYHSTALHELVHWSEHRLRWLADPHLSIKERYRIGEWRATWGSAVLCAEIGVPFYHGPKGHAMFVGTWMQLMRADNTFVFRVAEALGEAARFILSFSRIATGIFPHRPKPSPVACRLFQPQSPSFTPQTSTQPPFPPRQAIAVACPGRN